MSVILSDTHLLNCQVCLLPFTPPAFQCENGHFACHSCCVKMRNKCHSCERAIGRIRCLAIEKLIEFNKLPCPHASHGCNKTFSFNGYFERVLHHFVVDVHSASPSSHFHYNTVFSVFLAKDDNPFVVLQAEEDHCFFVLYNKKESIGSLITVFLAEPSSSSSKACEFLYNVSVSRNESSSSRSFRFHSVMKGVKGLEECCSPTEFLLVPCGFFGESEQMKLDVCIWHSDVVTRKKKYFPAHKRAKVEVNNEEH